MINLLGFKVVYGEKVLNALQLLEFSMPEDFYNHEIRPQTQIAKPKFIDVMAINEDGNVIIIHDESWKFQFIPIVRS